ncbi:glycosyltransferase family 39 protein, partial [Burkholderia pseudomallei]
PTTLLAYAANNQTLFTWPAWPLAISAWVRLAGLRRRPHIAIPLSVDAPLLALEILHSQQTNRMYMLLLPALDVIATFALPTLKRGAINAIDWIAVLSYTILGT